MSYAFTFDARACTGCKTCQEACKDKNQLPVGVLWRRVIEVSGGEWHSTGDAWESSVFAYYFSLACNHCTHPKCAGVCPTDAYSVRPDGIVLIDPTRCMGCGYCGWACPYGVPQYDPERGVMTKCDFCADNLDAGLPPSCVAACPLRVLNYATVASLENASPSQNLWQEPASQHPYPLPNYSRTEPHLAIKPHVGMTNGLGKVVSNREEVLPPGSYDYSQARAGKHELPLVAFTLLIQAAVGMVVYSLALNWIPASVFISVGIFLAAGGLISFLHLGRMRNAWRSVIHLKKSWLSREILMAGLFGVAWVVTGGAQWSGKAAPSIWPLAVMGIGLIYSMARVYLLRAVPAWNSWRTPLAFYISAAILGAAGINLLIPKPGWLIASALAMAAGLIMSYSERRTEIERLANLRIILLVLGFGTAVLAAFLRLESTTWLAILIFAIALPAEVIGRWLFYLRREPFPMQSR